MPHIILYFQNNVFVLFDFQYSITSSPTNVKLYRPNGKVGSPHYIKHMRANLEINWQAHFYVYWHANYWLFQGNR